MKLGTFIEYTLNQKILVKLNGLFQSGKIIAIWAKAMRIKCCLSYI